jgi:hypothetical protein
LYSNWIEEKKRKKKMREYGIARNKREEVKSWKKRRM